MVIYYRKNFRGLEELEVKNHFRRFLNDRKFIIPADVPLDKTFQKRVEYVCFKLLQTNVLYNNISNLRMCNSSYNNVDGTYTFLESFKPYDITFKNGKVQYFIDVKYGSKQEPEFHLSSREIDWISRRIPDIPGCTKTAYNIYYVTDFANESRPRSGSMYVISQEDLIRKFKFR